MTTHMTQRAPVPTELYELVDRVKYKPGWRVWLSDEERDPGTGAGGLTLNIACPTLNSYPKDPGDPRKHITVRHLFIVPAATWNRRSWRRWLFEQFCLVEKHEAMEFFEVDGEKPYAPHHGPGEDVYTVYEVGTDEDRRTLNTGKVKEQDA